jgi:peptide chain release factor 3
LRLFNESNKTKISDSIDFDNINDTSLSDHIGEQAASQLREDIELVTEVYPSFDPKAYLNGEQQPVFFGSALNNFGVQELLDAFIEIAPPPLAKNSAERLVKPDEKDFSGFVFKIHANMDPKHRDRLAFIKIVSGTFTRNTPYLHVRQNKKLKFSSPNAFFADRKEVVAVSYPGDIVGLHDTGNFKIGDTLTAGETLHFSGVPSFSPEHFRYINNADPMKAKQLAKGIDQLMDEGVAQLFTLDLNGRKVIGTVGALQFEVIQYRLEHEYGAKCTYENLNVFKACWVETQESGDADFKNFTQTKAKFLAKDKEGQLVFLADSAFSLQMTKDKYPQIAFHASSEF